MIRKGMLSRRFAAWVCAAVLLISLVPLGMLAFRDHAFYDDLGYTITTHRVWQETGSVPATLLQGVRNAISTRNTWEGNYTATFLFSIQPALFSESLYWITPFALIGMLLIALLFFFREVLCCRLGTDRSTFAILFSCFSFLMIQLAPSPDEAFFWFNGGMAYTFLWSLALIRLTLMLSMERTRSRGGLARRFVWLVFFSFLCGGAKFSTLLLTILIDVLFCLWVFVRKRPCRWLQLILTAILLGGFALCATAPGNAVRALTLHSSVSAPKAVLQALYFGVSLMGHWFTLPVGVIWFASAALLAPYLKRAAFSFRMPAAGTIVLMGLFCAQLAPTLVTGNYLGDGRTQDTYYYTYLLTGCVICCWWLGWYLRKTQGITGSLKIRSWAFAAALLLLCIGLAGFRPDGAESWGPQNTASGSAVRSLLNGEAAEYDRLMTERENILKDVSVTDPVLEPVTVSPRLFMGDALLSENAEYMLNLYAEYYAKNSVTMPDAAGSAQ